MRQNGNIKVQDPSASPTFALSRPSNNPDVPPSFRRNLFGSHLSRRPALPVPNASTHRSPDPFQSMDSTDRHPQPEIYHQSTSHNQPAVNSHHAYEPRMSPTRSLSPTKPQPHTTSNASIIALDPSTGRALLPVMPQLPARLREGSDDEDEDENDISDEGDQEDEHSMAWRRMKAFERANASQHDVDMQSSSMTGLPSQPPPRLHELIDPSAGGGDYRDYEKIEDILSKMVSQQKDRARTAVLPESASSFAMDTPTDSNGISARTRGKSRTATKGQPDHSRSSQPQSQSRDRPRIGGVGATLDPKDKDELLGLIMTSLSKKVQEADEDAWMFGEERSAANGVSVSGSYNYSGGQEGEY